MFLARIWLPSEQAPRERSCKLVGEARRFEGCFSFWGKGPLYPRYSDACGHDYLLAYSCNYAQFRIMRSWVPA
jgi:hypothetical protein